MRHCGGTLFSQNSKQLSRRRHLLTLSNLPFPFPVSPDRQNCCSLRWTLWPLNGFKCAKFASRTTSPSSSYPKSRLRRRRRRTELEREMVITEETIARPEMSPLDAKSGIQSNARRFSWVGLEIKLIGLVSDSSPDGKRSNGGVACIPKASSQQENQQTDHFPSR